MRVSWVKTKIQAFGDLLDSAAINSVPVSCEDVEVVETFTYLGSVIHNSAECEAEVHRRLGLAKRGYGFTEEDSLELAVFEQRNEDPCIQVVGHASLALFLRDMDID
mgnify:CR=1 FL=1